KVHPTALPDGDDYGRSATMTDSDDAETGAAAGAAPARPMQVRLAGQFGRSAQARNVLLIESTFSSTVCSAWSIDFFSSFSPGRNASSSAANFIRAGPYARKSASAG